MTNPVKLFISHASEDKDAIVRSLATSLIDAGFAVWYDEFTLRIGDSLKQQIDAGLRECDYGVVVLSPSFFAKRWPREELDGLTSMEVLRQRNVVFPVWHDVTFDDVASFSPTLAGKISAHTSEGLQGVVQHIVRSSNSEERDRFLSRSRAASDTASINLRISTCAASLMGQFSEDGAVTLEKRSDATWEELGRDLLEECKELDRKSGDEPADG